MPHSFSCACSTVPHASAHPYRRPVLPVPHHQHSSKRSRICSSLSDEAAHPYRAPVLQACPSCTSSPATWRSCRRCSRSPTCAATSWAASTTRSTWATCASACAPWRTRASSAWLTSPPPTTGWRCGGWGFWAMQSVCQAGGVGKPQSGGRLSVAYLTAASYELEGAGAGVLLGLLPRCAFGG
jgi:hypothetical protein